MRLLAAAGLAASLLLPLGGLSAAVRADEGMWLLTNLPTAQLAKRGFTPTPEFIRSMQLAAVNFDGASGSFVSAEGLVMTNHHVGSSAISRLSTPGNDLLVKGYLAKDRAAEKMCKGLVISILEQITDVTAEVNGAVTAEMDDGEAAKARRAAIAKIEKRAADENAKAKASPNAELESEVVSLYTGGKFQLHTKRRFNDVRLVFAPEQQIAFYGGDNDNFEFPRFDLDVTFFRVYVDGKPYTPASHLRLGAGAKAGDLTLVFGHPGRTERLLTADELRFLRDVRFPAALSWLWREEVRLQGYVGRGAEQQRVASEDLFGIANARKAYTGELAGLQDPVFMGKKVAQDQALRDAVAAKPEWQAKWGGAWDRIQTAVLLQESIFVEHRAWQPRGSAALSRGFTLARLGRQLELPSAERAPAFRDGAVDQLIEELKADVPMDADYERFCATGYFARLLEIFGGDLIAERGTLNGLSPAARASEIIGQTKLLAASEVAKLLAGGAKAIEASQDPLIVAGRQIDDAFGPLDVEMRRDVEEIKASNSAKIAQARFAVYGETIYPDANSTLRLAFGPIEGYQSEGKSIAPMTTFGGLYAKAAERGEQSRDYKLPESWVKVKDKINPQTPFNFVCSADIIGGNSGSPVVNAKGELIGLIFDGNIESLPGAFAYDGSNNRAVAVDMRAIIEALGVVYDAGHIAAEIKGVAGQGK